MAKPSGGHGSLLFSYPFLGESYMGCLVLRSAVPIEHWIFSPRSQRSNSRRGVLSQRASLFLLLLSIVFTKAYPSEQNSRELSDPAEKVTLDLFLMSHCPYGIKAELELIRFAKQREGEADLRIYYIARRDDANEERREPSISFESSQGPESEGACRGTGEEPYLGFRSLHGGEEVLEDMRQLIIKDFYPEEFLDYVELRARDIDAGWEESAIQLGIDPAVIEEMTYNGTGELLLEENSRACKELGVFASPTLIINGKQFRRRITYEAIRNEVHNARIAGQINHRIRLDGSDPPNREAFDGPPARIELLLGYDKGKIHINRIMVKRGFSHTPVLNNESNFHFETSSDDGEILYELPLSLPRIVVSDWFTENGRLTGKSYDMMEDEFIVALPYLRDAAHISLHDERSNILFSLDIPKWEKLETAESGDIAVYDSSGEMISIYKVNSPVLPGKNVFSQENHDMQAAPRSELDSICKKVYMHGDQDIKIDVVFVYDGFTSDFTVSNLEPGSYLLADDMAPYDIYYVDRDYYIDAIPSRFPYKSLTWIRTANDDKEEFGEDWISFTVDDDVRVYVGIDTREGLPSWIADEGWVNAGDSIGIYALNGNVVHSLYYKNFPAGYVGIDGNEDKGNMYLVFVESRSDERRREVRNVTIEHIDTNDEYEGILSMEPLQSSQDKFNFYFIDDYYTLNCEDPGTCQKLIAQELADHCGAYDEIIVLINNGPDDYANGWAYLNGHFAVSDAYSKTSKPAPGVTAHEFGHSWGNLADEYYKFHENSKTWLVNCEPANTEVACEDWCFGTPLEPIFVQCNYYEDEVSCENDFRCVWQDEPDPYFGVRCLDTLNMINIGTDCIEGTGCYWNCGGINGWRPVQDNSIMFTIRETENVHDAPSIAFLEGLLALYPDSILLPRQE
jgi:hypothetical protein